MQSYLIKSTLIFTTALLIAGCQNYQSRHEGYSISAGDAQAINEAKMVEDPWKKSADNNQINSDGKRLGDAVKRYKNLSLIHI